MTDQEIIGYLLLADWTIYAVTFAFFFSLFSSLFKWFFYWRSETEDELQLIRKENILLRQVLEEVTIPSDHPYRQGDYK